jgi:phosphoribosylformylglycinamidine synthase
MIKVIVTVTPKKSVLDPQGEAVRKAVEHLGIDQVRAIRVGKHIEMEIDAKDAPEVRDRVEAAARDLLSNPVIEDYTIQYT